jgi:hypothetical protein
MEKIAVSFDRLLRRAAASVDVQSLFGSGPSVSGQRERETRGIDLISIAAG